jgi:nitrogen fixation protein NifX
MRTFGWARHLAVYDITPRATASCRLHAFGEDLAEDGNEDKLAPKLEIIKDCAIVYVAAIGGSAAARVVASKIHPVKVTQPEPILDILDGCRSCCRERPRRGCARRCSRVSRAASKDDQASTGETCDRGDIVRCGVGE